MSIDTQISSHTINPIDIGLAVRACNADAVPGLLNELFALEKSSPIDHEDTRISLLTLASSLINALETPRETMIKHNWAQPGCHVAITTCYNAGVFKALGDGLGKVNDIASMLGMDRDVLARLMKHIAAMGYIEETGPDEYASTNFSRALTIPVIGDGYPVCAGGIHVSCNKFSQYMEQMEYQNPVDIEPKPYQYAYNTDMDMFGYIHAHPPLDKQFNNHMGGYRQGRPSWMDRHFYPVEEQLFKGMNTSQDAVLLVDVGGGQGHDLEEFHTKHPNAPGRLVLQDRLHVLDGIQQLDCKIERMEHDFLTAQPLKAARAYYMHSVLHDWTDDVCKNILKQLVGAMKRGYSRLLINENVIPDKGADWQTTGLDMVMMTCFASKERTLFEWHQLLESPEIGLKIIRVWSANHSQESLIECELP